ncbi:MAG: hypothetical protein SF123_19665 [Chloroflexota bacterium]|nr:hypothetical protein [Chloroflexota bacterium]
MATQRPVMIADLMDELFTVQGLTYREMQKISGVNLATLNRVANWRDPNGDYNPELETILGLMKLINQPWANMLPLIRPNAALPLSENDVLLSQISYRLRLLSEEDLKLVAKLVGLYFRDTSQKLNDG